MISKHIFTSDVVSGKALWINNLQSTGNLVTANSNFTITNDATILGDLTVKGSTTTIDTVTLTVDDHNIELGSIDNPTDSTADGGGITLKGSTDKTFNWSSDANAWESNVGLNVLGGNVGIGTSDPKRKLHLVKDPVIVLTDSTGSEDPLPNHRAIVNNLELLNFGKYNADFSDYTSQLVIDYNGNVGIGITSPDYKLHVDGGGYFAGEAIPNTAPDNGVYLGQSAGGPDYHVSIISPSSKNSYIDFSTTTRDAIGRILYSNPDASLPQGMHFYSNFNGGVTGGDMFIDPNGNLGIGTTSPDNLLHVKRETTDNTYAIIENTTVGNAGINLKNAAGDWNIVANAELRFIDNGAGDRMCIDSNGNVGIGATSPGGKLDVKAGTAQLRMNYASSMFTNGAAGEVGLTFTDKLHIGVSPSALMTIEDTGNVGIGTTAPQALFHVPQGSSTIGGNDLTKASILIGNATEGIGIDDNEIIKKGGNIVIGAADTNASIQFRTNQQERLVIENTGTSITGTLTTSGAITVNNSSPILVLRDTNGGDAVSQNGFISYRDNSDTERGYVGFGSGADKDFTVSNKIGDINLSSKVGGKVYIPTSLQLGNGVTLAESTDRADMLKIQGITSGYAGVVISNTNGEDLWSLMADGNLWGVYNDSTNAWHIQCNDNGAVDLFYGNVERLNTSASGVTINGNIDNVSDIYLRDQIIHHGDTDTYMQFHAADQWRVVAGGSEIIECTNTAFNVAKNTSMAGSLTVAGNLTVNGTTSTINSTTVTVDDKNIELGSVASPTNDTANGGGITLKGATDKTISWSKATTSWDVSENLGVADGKYVFTDRVRARDAAGLLLQDDSGNGITINDGGNTSVSHAFAVGGNTTIGGNTSIVGTTYLGGAATFNDNVTINAAKTLQVGNVTVADGKSISTDKIEARDSSGLSLVNDAGQGITISDTEGRVSTTASLSVGESLAVAGATSLSSTLQVVGDTTFVGDISSFNNTTANFGGNVNIGGETTFEGATVFQQNVVISGDFNVTSETPMTLEQGTLEIQTLTSPPTTTTNQLYNLNNNIYWNGTNLVTSHPNISAASSSNNSGRTYIQDITVDSNGHVTNIATATETVTNTNTTYSAGDHLNLNSTTFSVKRDLRGSSGSTSNGVYVIGQNFDDYFMVHGISTNYADWYQGGDLRMRLTSPVLTAGSADLHVEGDVLAFSSTVSDKNFKDNINTIDNALYKVNKLRGVEFEWNSTSRKGEKDIGVVAQEVEEVLPEIVREKTPCVGEFCENTEKYKTVDYQKLTAVLIEAVKELSAEVEDLKKKLS